MKTYVAACPRPKRHSTLSLGCRLLALLSVPAAGLAQINTGSNGADGVFSPASNTVIDMADHPNGVYQYVSVNIPQGVTVSFVPNANNSPVTWLVQGSVVINGRVDVSGKDTASNQSNQGAVGGPGGWQGGNGFPSSTGGQGPGGGSPGMCNGGGFGYGNAFLIPLLGGSGGGGSASQAAGGGGGGGAILIASSVGIAVNSGAAVYSQGGSGFLLYTSISGGGSGGAVRLVAPQISGAGIIRTDGGYCGGGPGRIRFDTYDNEFSGNLYGSFTQGFQPVIVPSAGQVPQLTITTIAGAPVTSPPSGVLSTPDAVISGQQPTPIPVVVQCANVPLGSTITVNVKPVNGGVVTATGSNNTGTLASSTATVLVNMPRGGGLIYATATN